MRQKPEACTGLYSYLLFYLILFDIIKNNLFLEKKI